MHRHYVNMIPLGGEWINKGSYWTREYFPGLVGEVHEDSPIWWALRLHWQERSTLAQMPVLVEGEEAVEVAKQRCEEKLRAFMKVCRFLVNEERDRKTES